MATKRLSSAELRARRVARQQRKQSAANTNKNGKYQRYPPAVRPSQVDRQRERVAWALTRVRSARSKAAIHKDDRVWQAAYAARRAEYERELLALDRLTTT